MKKRFTLGSLSMESFDQAPTGNVTPTAQPEVPEQPLVTAGYTETPFSGSETYAAETRKFLKSKGLGDVPALESAAEHTARELWAMLFKSHDVSSEADIHDAFALNPGASDSQLHQVASYFHGKLPDLLVELLKIYNGQPAWWNKSGTSGYEDIYPHVCIMFGTDDMMEMSKQFIAAKGDMDEWYGPIDTDPRIKAVQWNQHWLPLASNEDHKRATTYVLDFDPGPGGKHGQVVKIEQLGNKRIVLGDNFDTWFPGLIKRHANYMSLESRTKPMYPLRPALEADAIVVDDDELDALVSQANNLTKMCDNTAEIALEAASDLAKSKMHLRFKRLKDSFADSFKSTNSMIVKYRDRLEELKHELSGTMVHGQLEVNMSGLWQHFSNEAGPVTSNLVGKVKEDAEFSRYILTDFSQKAYDELVKLEHALHTGQGNSDDEAKRTALDVEKCSSPAEYMNQKWLCAAGEQPYLSVTGIYGRQGQYPRPVAISGVSLDRLAQLSCHYYVREYGSFLHGMKKLFVHDSKKTTRLSESDLEQLIKLGEEYLNGAQHYLELYHKVWAVFSRIDSSLDQIWDDFDLTDYHVEVGGEEDDDKISVTWQTSGTGPVERRAKVFDQLMGVVSNFSDATIMPGFHEMTRALRAAKYHTYIVAAGLKAAGKNKVAQEFFGFGKKEAPSPKGPSYSEPKDKDIPAPDWDPHHPPAIAQTWKAFIAFVKEVEPKAMKYVRPMSSINKTRLGTLKIAVEEETGKKIPAELIELWSLTDGWEGSSTYPSMFDYHSFLPVAQALTDYSNKCAMMDEDWADSKSKCYEGVKGERWYEPWWIPFTNDGGGDALCVDMNPGSGGHAGQVIAWYHDASDRSVVAPSIAALFALNLHRQMYRHRHKKDWDAQQTQK